MNLPGIATAAAVALSIIGLTASMSQYLAVARQEEAIKSIALVQAPVVKSIERFIDPANGSFALTQLKNYQVDSERFTAGLLKATASMADRERLCLLLWLLSGVSSSIALLALLRRRGA